MFASYLTIDALSNYQHATINNTQVPSTYKSPKLNISSTESLFDRETLSLSSRGIGISKIVKSIAIETPLEAYVAVLLSIHLKLTLLSKTPPAPVSNTVRKNLQEAYV